MSRYVKLDDILKAIDFHGEYIYKDSNGARLCEALKKLPTIDHIPEVGKMITKEAKEIWKCYNLLYCIADENCEKCKNLKYCDLICKNNYLESDFIKDFYRSKK